MPLHAGQDANELKLMWQPFAIGAIFKTPQSNLNCKMRTGPGCRAARCRGAPALRPTYCDLANSVDPVNLVILDLLSSRSLFGKWEQSLFQLGVTLHEKGSLSLRLHGPSQWPRICSEQELEEPESHLVLKKAWPSLFQHITLFRKQQSLTADALIYRRSTWTWRKVQKFEDRQSFHLRPTRSSNIGSKRSWPFLEEKSRDEVRPDIFGATAPRRIRFNEKFERYACGRSILIWILMNLKQMKNEVNFRRKCGNSGNGSHLRAKIVDFCETRLWWYY